MIKGCPTSAEDLDKYLTFREAKAAELLFTECLQSEALQKIEMINKKAAAQTELQNKRVAAQTELQNKRVAAVSMFGKNVIITPRTSTDEMEVVPSIKKEPVKKAPMVQQGISAFLHDGMVVDAINKKKRATAAAAAKKKKEAETE